LEPLEDDDREDLPPHDTIVADHAEVVTETTTSAAPEIELTESNCPQLFQKLLGTLGLTISAGLKQASGLQLGSDNRLEILLDSTSEFSRKALDQAENRARIEAEVLRLTGRTVSLALRLTAPKAAHKATPESTTESHPPVRSAAPKDTRQTSPSGQKNQRPESAAPAAAPLRNLMGEIDPSSDRFVREVMDTFGATVVRITTAPAVQPVAAEIGDE
jgi:hypothetical protein